MDGDAAPAPPEDCVVAPVLVVGCGNLLGGDDAVGPLVVRRLAERGVPDGVELLDAGTAAVDAVLAMRGRHKVVVVDAASTGAEPGTLHRVPAEQLRTLPPAAGLDVHALRWDQALAVGSLLLGDGCPGDVVALLVEAASTEPGAALTPAVATGLERAVELVLDEVAGGGPAW